MDCYVPEFPDPYLLSDSKDLTVELYSALHGCNDDMAAIRELQPAIPEGAVENLVYPVTE